MAAILVRRYYAPSYPYLDRIVDIPVVRLARGHGDARQDQSVTPRVDMDRLSDEARGRLAESMLHVDADGWIIEVSASRMLNVTVKADEAKDLFIEPSCFMDEHLEKFEIGIVWGEWFGDTIDVRRLSYMRGMYPDGEPVCLGDYAANTMVIPNSRFTEKGPPRSGRTRLIDGFDIMKGLYDQAPPLAAVPGGGRVLDLGSDREETPSTFPSRFFAPPSNAENTRDTVVFGVKNDLSGYEQFNAVRPEYAHLGRFFVFNCWTVPWNRVFIHHSTDGWRFLFALEATDAPKKYQPAHTGPVVNYCVALFFPESEISKFPSRVAGLSAEDNQHIRAVPGMSVAMMLALNTLRSQMRNVAYDELHSIRKFQPGHFLACLSARKEVNTFATTRHSQGPWYAEGYNGVMLHRVSLAAWRFFRRAEGVATIPLVSLLLPDSECQAEEITVQPVATPNRRVRLFRRATAVEAEKRIVKASRQRVLRELDL